MDKRYDIAIIGAGASGLAAAIAAKQVNPKCSVVVLEKKDVAGKKLRATGNGRCNLSNAACENLQQVLAFLAETGISTREDDSGRIYPYSEDAGQVTETLVNCALGYGVEIGLNSEVKEIRKVEAGKTAGFHIFVDKNKICADKVLIATGGKSYGNFGTTGDGYKFAKAFGHSVSKPVPSLTAVEISENIKSLKGVRVKGRVSLLENDTLRFSESGEIQFRDDSISGICVMNMSAHLTVPQGMKPQEALSRYTVTVNLVPEMKRGQLEQILTEKAARSKGLAGNILSTLVKGKLADYILKLCAIYPSRYAVSLSSDEISALANYLQDLRFTVAGLKGWNEAQVTRGGVVISEMNGETMESKLISGLYFSGEVLDYDGPCGGFNLHNAWLTGMKAGKDMGKCTEFIR